MHRGVPRLLPKYFIDTDGNIIEGELSEKMKESLVPFDLEFVTDYERKIRSNYIQVVQKIGNKLYPTAAVFDKLPNGLFVATADWLGDGRIVDFDSIEYAKDNFYANLENLPYDRQAKMLKYIAGPKCPWMSSLPKNLKIEYKEGIDRLGTILINPDVAKQIMVKHRYPPFKEIPLPIGAKIRGPFIKGTIVYDRNVEGIRFLEGSFKSLPEGPIEAIKCGFWVESLPQNLCKNKVRVSYTAHQHFAKKLPDDKKVNKFISGDVTREEIINEFRFNNKGQLQTLKVIEMIREGVPINFGYPYRFYCEKVSDMIDRKIFNPILPGIRAIGVENNTRAKEVIIPMKYANMFKIGEKAILYRDPSSWIGAFQIVKVAGYAPDSTLKLPRRCAVAMEGDFDGDQYNLLKISTLNETFDVDIVDELKRTPKIGHFPGKKAEIESGNDRKKLYNVAIQIEMVKNAVGLLIHFRDNAWMRGLLDQKGIEWIYHNAAQRALQSKNEASNSIDVSKYPFEIAKMISEELGIDKNKLVKRNGTLNAFRKKDLFPHYNPDPNSRFYDEIVKYTVPPFTLFNARKTAEMIQRKKNIPDNHVATAKAIIYKFRDVEELEDRRQKIRNECDKYFIHEQAIIVAFLKIAAKRPMGEELIMAIRTAKDIKHANDEPDSSIDLFEF
jgi:hypothetical protein